MAAVPKTTSKRISDALKRFQPILQSARDRDVNESDTVVIITDMLAELFGYDKYSEITSEHAIKGTFCDLAVIINSEVQFLIEVKAIGMELKEMHVKQAVDYACNKGVDWAILTNGIHWKVFKVIFQKPIDQELVLDFSLTDLNPKNTSDIENLFLLAKEGLRKSVLSDYHTQKQATNRFILSALIRSDPVLKMICRELKKITPGLKVNSEDIEQILTHEVLKREVVQGEEVIQAEKMIKKIAKKTMKKKKPVIEKVPDTQRAEEPKIEENITGFNSNETE
jgi:predicted type IV restriction endonuclease